VVEVKDIVALKEVKDDLDKGEEFYDFLSKGKGDYFREQIILDIKSIKHSAGVHAKQFGYFRKLSKKFPYAIYYDIIENIVVIVAVLDMRVEPNKTRKNITNRNI
jgi:hypothetical protein